MKVFKRCICLAKAVGDWFLRGIWVPHVFEDTYEKAIIIATSHGFRVAHDYQHSPDETVYKDGYLIRSRCIHCGKVELSWMQDSRFLDLEEVAECREKSQ